AAVIFGAAVAADVHCDRPAIRIGPADVAERFLLGLHLLEGDVLGGFRGRRDQAVVLLREKALWNDDEKVDGERERGEEDHERHALPAERKIEAALIATQHGVEAALAPLIELAVILVLAVRAQ